MMICVDLGNTTTALGVLEGTDVKRFWRIMTRERTSDEYSALISSLLERNHIDRSKLHVAGICSVVPSETRQIAEALASDPGIRVEILSGSGDYGIKVLTDNPAEVGADRIANAVGAFYQYGGPAIVVDMGTATTFDLISREGEYRGGVIAPGMMAGAKDLWKRARMLPAVEISQPVKIVGTTTVQCMQSGIFYGNVGQIEGIVKRMWDEIGDRYPVIMTGGWAGLIWKQLSFETTFDLNLTLKGIAYAIDSMLRR